MLFKYSTLPQVVNLISVEFSFFTTRQPRFSPDLDNISSILNLFSIGVFIDSILIQMVYFYIRHGRINFGKKRHLHTQVLDFERKKVPSKMSKRKISVLLAIVLLVSLFVPSVAHAEAMTQREAAEFLLHWIGYTDEEIAYGGGVDQSAISLDLVQDYIPTYPCSNDQFEAMRQRALVLAETKPPIPKDPNPNDVVDPPEVPEFTVPTVPPETTEPETTEPETTEPAVPSSPLQFQDGLAQPVFDINTDIERFSVYVETDYDTDGDGKLDLIKVVVQLPTAAMNGEYQAGVIYEARPYIAGEGSQPSSGTRCTEEDLYKTVPCRTPRGTATTAEVAASASSSEYNFYENIDWYDYFLVRGFAVVTAAGPGTRGSEGYETCGTDLEIDAFASVIEWLNGSPDAVAYTNRTDNISVDADWCNGSVGMTGRSYAGTTQFGIAGTGVQGLKTIVPVSGIASWYEYTNSQGYRTRSRSNYSTWLASHCASRVHDGGWDQGRYGSYLRSISRDESNLNGDYGKHFERRDYTLNPNIQCSALIVQGVNDDNVRSKNAQMMYDAFTKAGQNVKLLLHQDGHVTPAYGANKTEQLINGEAYQQVLNRWFSHYLFDVQNNAENMAAVTAQDNYDASMWHLYDSWETNNTLTMTSGSMKLNQEVTIQGTIPVTVKATPRSTADNNLLHVQLVDTAASSFNAYRMSGSYESSYHSNAGTFHVGGNAEDYRIVNLNGYSTREKVIAEGWMDLANPSAGFASSTATPESIQRGQEYTYTVWLQPNLYRVAAGHTLELRVSAKSGNIRSYSAAIPVREAVAPASYTVEYSAQNNGRIVSEVPSGELVEADTPVTLTAAPNVGYTFSFWTVNGKNVSGTPTSTFTITEDTSIVAHFIEQVVPNEAEDSNAPEAPTAPEKPQRPGRPNRPGRPSWPIWKWPFWHN